MLIKGRPHPNHEHIYAEYWASLLHRTSTNGCNRIVVNDFSVTHSTTYKVIHVENREETSRGKHHKPMALATYTDKPFPLIL